MTTPPAYSVTEQSLIDAILTRPGVTGVDVEEHPDEPQPYLVRVHRAGGVPPLEFQSHRSRSELLVTALGHFKSRRAIPV